MARSRGGPEHSGQVTVHSGPGHSALGGQVTVFATVKVKHDSDGYAAFTESAALN